LKIGDVDLAISIYEKLREKYEESHDRKGIALCSGDLASAYRQTGRYDEAITLFKGALRYAHQTKDRYEIQNNFISIGNCYIGTGDYQKALTYFNKALPITVERGDITNNIINSFSIFAAYIKLKRYDDAKQVLEVMKDSVFSFGNDRFKSIYLSNEGIIFEKKLEFSMAILKYNSAYKAAKEITDPYVLFLILKNRAFCNYKLKKYKETIADINKSLTLVGERYKSQKRIIAEMRALLKKAEAKNT
jgi:tetratricopeptide (TPR) repeat protein